MTATAHEWPWERLEQTNVGSHETLIEATAPQPGERVLDIGTGSGALALRAARTGANVVGVDISESGIERARSLAAEEGLDVQFDIGDAQALPYPDGTFDVVVSAFGINFAADRHAAARELARVCRAGGRIGLALMPRESRGGDLFATLRAYGGVRGDHPADFAEDVDALLANDFDYEARLREVPAHHSPGSHQTWEESLATFGPLKAVVERLEPERVDELRAEIRALFERWADRPASYVLVLGTRR